MAKDDKKTKAAPPPKAEVAAKKKDEAAPKDKAASGAEPAKAETGDTAEGQKPVTQAYKDNWNAIYGKKKR